MQPRAIVTALTLARFPMVALGFWAAFERDPLATITFGAMAVATDMGDGILARRWGVTSEWGSNLDSFADFVFYSSLAIWAFLFAGDALLAHTRLAITYFAAYCVALFLGYLLKGTIAVHDRMTRATGTVGGLLALWVIGVGYSEWVLVLLALFLTADLAHRLHAIVQAFGRRRRLPDA